MKPTPISNFPVAMAMDTYSRIMAFNIESIAILESYLKVDRCYRPDRGVSLEEKSGKAVYLLPIEPNMLVGEISDRLNCRLPFNCISKRYLPVADYEILVEGLISLIETLDATSNIHISFMADRHKALFVIEGVSDLNESEDALLGLMEDVGLMEGEVVIEFNAVVVSLKAHDKFD